MRGNELFQLNVKNFFNYHKQSFDHIFNSFVHLHEQIETLSWVTKPMFFKNNMIEPYFSNFQEYFDNYKDSMDSNFNHLESMFVGTE